MLIRGCHAPVLGTPGDGRSASQGTDLPRAVGEKRRQRHFGILWRSAQSRKLGCVFCVQGTRPLALRVGLKPYRSGRRPSDTAFAKKQFSPWGEL